MKEKLKKKNINHLLEKMLATMLVITLTFANTILIFSYFTQGILSYAVGENLENQTVETQHANVEFNTYFKKADETKAHSLVCDVNKQNNIYFSINVKNKGYLKNAVIELTDTEEKYNLNYKIDTTSRQENIQSITENKIELKQINAGSVVEFNIPITLTLDKELEASKLNQTNIATLKGVYVDENGEEVKIEKDIYFNLGWSGEYTTNLAQGLNKYIPFNIGDKKGIIVQFLVESGLQNKENETVQMSIKSTNIIAQVPTFEEKLPKEINVSTLETNATNGRSNNEIEWNYDEENSIVNISLNNEEADKKLWVPNGTDKILITYIYNEEAFNEIKTEGNVITSKINSIVEVFKNNGTEKIENEVLGEATLIEKIGDTVTYELSTDTLEISKGKLYANSIGEKTYNIEYNVDVATNISYKELVESIKIDLVNDQFLTEKQELNANSYYKQIKISKEQFEEILGEEGKIQIINGNSVISTIDNSVNTDEQDNIIVDLKDGYENIQIITTKPISEGILEILTTKVINKTVLEKEEIQELKEISIVGKQSVKYTGVEEYVQTQENEIKIPLKETTSNVILEMSNTNLSALDINQDVELNIKLNNNKETSDLYKNPTFQIELPEFVEDITIKDYSILNGEDFKVEKIEKQIINNKVILNITLSGTQKEFYSNVTSGTNIKLNTDIKVREFIPTQQENIHVFYTNETATNYTVKNTEGYGYAQMLLGAESPKEIITKNTMSNYNEQEQSVTSTNGEEKTGLLNVFSNSRKAKNTISIMNNLDDSCTNIKILGRIPFEGNKSIEDAKNLGSTFSTTLSSKLVVSDKISNNVTIYYSENGSATKDLEDKNNGWSTTISDLTKVKSYLVVFNDSIDLETKAKVPFTFAKGDIIEFSYEYIIPEKLEHNQKSFSTYGVYYDVQENSDVQEADKVGIATTEGANADITIEAFVGENKLENNAEIKEKETIKYVITVKNTGTTVLNSGVVKAKVPSQATLEKYNNATLKDNELTWNIGNVNGGESKILEYEVTANEIKTSSSSDNVSIYTSASLTAENIAKQLDSETISTKVKGASLTVELQSDGYISQIKENEDITYVAKIKNRSSETMKNVVLTYKIPDGLSYKGIEVKDSMSKPLTEGYKEEYNKDTRQLTVIVNQIESIKNVRIFIKLQSTNLASGIYESELKNIVTVKAENVDTFTSNSLSTHVQKAALEVSQKGSVENKYIREGDSVEYIFEIKNIGKLIAENVVLTDLIPDGMKCISIKYIKNEKESQANSNDNYNVTTLKQNISPDSSIIIKLKVVAQDLPMGATELSTKNKAIIKGDNVEEVTTNEVEYIIEPKIVETEEDNNNSNDNTQNNNNTPNAQGQKYKITGKAWIDANSNGKIDENEEYKKDIPVMLINTSGNVVSKRTTSNNGEYVFENVENGEYFIIFEYDAGNYTVTSYKAIDVSELENSDAIESVISIDGEEKTAGVTDKITVNKGSISGINLGIIESAKFDLRLDKYITKAVVKTSEGTKTYEYDNQTFAKLDIHRKQIEGAQVTIEYKLIVKNEGAIAGYAKTIVDYIPENMKFDGNGNTGWKIGTDGNLYNTTLENVLINPGESKELTLKLTKTMTKENTGIINNNAEISEAYNKQNKEDLDSTPDNKAQGEDDLGVANIIVTVGTGEELIYLSIIMISILILGSGIYLINKKVLKGGNQ